MCARLSLMLVFETIYSWVKDLPIIDWHNHLDMQALTEDKPLGSLYEVWVKSDPYKHRAMRICGESERLITGDAPEKEKWDAWKRTLPKLIGNPLFNWAKAELGLVAFFNAEAQRRGERRDSDWIRSLENISLADWTPSMILRKVNAEALSPCVDAGEIFNVHKSSVSTKTNINPLIVPPSSRHSSLVTRHWRSPTRHCLC